jgi:hypothetical protein
VTEYRTCGSHPSVNSGAMNTCAVALMRTPPPRMKAPSVELYGMPA